MNGRDGADCLRETVKHDLENGDEKSESNLLSDDNVQSGNDYEKNENECVSFRDLLGL